MPKVDLGAYLNSAAGRRGDPVDALSINKKGAKKLREIQNLAEDHSKEKGCNLYIRSSELIVSGFDGIHHGSYKNVDTGYDNIINKRNNWVGNHHVHPFKKRMHDDAWVGPSPADHVSWLKTMRNPTIHQANTVVRLVSGGKKLFLVVLNKERLRQTLIRNASRNLNELQATRKKLETDAFIDLPAWVAADTYEPVYMNVMTRDRASSTKDLTFLASMAILKGIFNRNLKDIWHVISELTHQHNIVSAHIEGYDYYMGDHPKSPFYGVTLRRYPLVQRDLARCQQNVRRWYLALKRRFPTVDMDI